MNSEKQKLLFSNMLSSPDVFAKCQTIIQGSYFDPDVAIAVNFVKKYYDQYHAIPAPETIEAEAGLRVEIRKLSPAEQEYTLVEMEKFCKSKALAAAVIASIDEVKAGNHGKVQALIDEAMQVGLQKNLGLRYFEDPEKRLKRMLDEPPTIKTGWKDLDDALFGGYSRKELLLVSANSGGGKSITLANLGFNAVKMGYNVLFISLELAEDVVAQRFDTMFTGISRKNWKGHVNEIVTGLQKVSENDPHMGKLDIVQLTSGTTANEIRAYLSNFIMYHGFKPDVLILDYLDKMGPNQKMNISDVWNKDKLCSEQLRDIGVDYDMAILTASQLNREAVKATSHDHTHIAGGISKINECDIYWSILLDDIKRAEKKCEFKLQKTRNSDGVGKTIVLGWDYKYLRIINPEDDNNGGGGGGNLNYRPDSGLVEYEKPPEPDKEPDSITEIFNLDAEVEKVTVI